MPVSMKKYRQEQEHLEAKMLEEYMKQSKALSLVLELKKRSEMKKYNEEVATYNLAVAQQAMVSGKISMSVCMFDFTEGQA